MKPFNLAIAAGFAAVMSISAASAADISGAGATFPYPIYAKWADSYKAETGIGLNYQPIGSGGGIKQIQAKTVTFGATDAPLKAEDLDKFGLLQFPTVMGGIVPVVNIDGVKPGELVLDGQTLVLGAETARDAVHIPLSAGYTTNAGTAELQSAWGNGIFSAASLRYDDNSQFGDRLTWRIAPSVALGETGIRLKASAGTGFKAPSLDQLYHDYPAFFFFANPGLKPETSIGYDVGADWTPFEGFSAGATWFRNDIRNLIATDPVTFSTDVNIGKAHTQGVELFAAWQAMETLKLRADYTYTDAIDGTTGLELLRRPRHKASLNAGWRFLPQAGLDVTLLYVGPWIDGSRDFSVPRLKTDGYVTMDLAAHYDLDARFTLFARASNLFYETYENPVGFLGPERAFYAGVQAKL